MPKFTLLSGEQSGKESCHWSVMCRLSLSVCISVSGKRRDNSGCEPFNMTLVMMVWPHHTDFLPFVDPKRFYRLVFSFLYFSVLFSWGSLFSLRCDWVHIHVASAPSLSLSLTLWGFDRPDFWTCEFIFHKIQNSLKKSPDLKRCTFISDFVFDVRTLNSRNVWHC